MYTLIDGLSSIATFGIFLWGCIESDYRKIIPGIVGYFAYPIVLEPIANAISYITYSENNYVENHQKKHNKMRKCPHPLIYNPRYNITACGLERCHPFDSTKYLRVIQILLSNGIITLESDLFHPEKAERSTLTRCISKFYLFSLCFTLNIVRIVEVPLIILPAFILRWRVLDPMLYATQGTIDGGCMALEKGWAINIGGGYHHASKTNGGGFCVFADITLCIEHLRRFHNDRVRKVVIIDLDAHQGNGHERDYIEDANVFIIDFYNHWIYPGDSVAKRGIKVDVAISQNHSDSDYFEKMEANIPSALDDFSPDFILYNAGTDCLENDPLGSMPCSVNPKRTKLFLLDLSLSSQGIIKRDEMIFSYALTRKIPILMVLSGGYQQENAPVIAQSIANIITKFR